eukprot:1947249-Prymnesium_polylepis.1
MVGFVARWSNALNRGCRRSQRQGAAQTHSRRKGLRGSRFSGAAGRTAARIRARELANRDRSRARPGDWP